MAISEFDRWRAAAQLIKQEGLEAEFDAVHRADEALDRGDIAEFSLWLDIGRKIQTLQQTRSPDIPLN